MKFITDKGLSILLWICLIGCSIGCRTSLSEETVATRVEPQTVAEGAKTMIVSAHPYATKAGLEILRQGGNAVDAAVAVQMALAVTYPRAGNIGGGGFMVIRDADGQSYALDHREAAPMAATATMYQDSLGNVLAGLSTEGHLAVGVPGTVAGLYEAWSRLGRSKDWSSLLQPAIRLARYGFEIDASEAARLNTFQSSFRAFHPQNSPFIREQWHAGDTLVQHELAQTLERIAAHGSDGFYTGPVAHAIVDEMNRGHGIITLADLSAYRAVWRSPVIGRFMDHEIISMPPPSSGGIALLQLLDYADQLDLVDHAPTSVQYAHRMTEAARRVYAMRAEYLGDPDHVQVDIQRLLDSAFLSKELEDFDPLRASPSLSVASEAYRLQLEHFETTHTSIIDEEGMAVSITTTLNTNYGSKVWVPGGGFFLNNEMDDFSAKPGVPNTYGLIGNEANAIAPGKRMLSSMTPTIMTDGEGHVRLVLGSPGGSTIITSVYQVILHILLHDMTVAEAVAAKRMHHQWLPDEIMHESGMWSEASLDSLHAMGHQTRSIDRIGLVKAVLRQADGQLIGSGDPRSGDHAEGY